MSFLMSSETEVPNIDEMKTFTGLVSKIERWQVKTHSGYSLFLELNGSMKRFGISHCEYPLNLGIDSKQLIFPGDVVTVLVDDAYFHVVGDGAVWQVEKNGVLVCPYERVVEIQVRSNEFRIKLATFLLIFGLLLSTIGIIRTRRATQSPKK